MSLPPRAESGAARRCASDDDRRRVAGSLPLTALPHSVCAFAEMSDTEDAHPYTGRSAIRVTHAQPWSALAACSSEPLRELRITPFFRCYTPLSASQPSTSVA